MSQPVEIPKILQDRVGPSLTEIISEKSREFRKKISRKMGRFITDISFDKSSVYVDDYDEGNEEKLDQDNAFATYEENLKESYYQEQAYKAKRFGSLVMTLPGLHAFGEAIGDHKRSRSRLKEKRAAFIDRNGTTKSRMRDRYIEHKEKYPD